MRGCGLSASGSGTPGCGAYASSGNTNLDQSFASELAIQRSFFGVPAGLAFLDDCDSPNALADPRTRTIYFGVRLIQSILAKFGADLPLAFILAHEYSHQLQFVFGWYDFNAPTVRDSELTADVLGAFYLLLAKSYADPRQFQASLAAVFDIGDYNFNSPGHHGTPLQRASAVVAGGRIALDFVAGRVGRTWPEVHARARAEVATIVANIALADERRTAASLFECGERDAPCVPRTPGD